jgi:hypothetical protein
VRDDNATLGDLGRDLGQHARDVLVGQTVEAVAPDAVVMEAARQGEPVRELGMAAVERGIEAGHLRQVGLDRGDGADHAKEVGVTRGAIVRPAPVDQDLALCVLGDEMRQCADALDLPLGRQQRPVVLADPVDREFQAGGAGIDGQDGVGHRSLLGGTRHTGPLPASVGEQHGNCTGGHARPHRVGA